MVGVHPAGSTQPSAISPQPIQFWDACWRSGILAKWCRLTAECFFYGFRSTRNIRRGVAPVELFAGGGETVPYAAGDFFADTLTRGRSRGKVARPLGRQSLDDGLRQI